MNRESKRHAAREEQRTEPKAGAVDTVGPRPAPPSRTSTRTSPAQFLREVRGELRKVAWPNRQEVVSYTLVVLVTTTVLTALVFGMDWVISNAVLNLF